jgi:hypothetical protein
MPGLVDFKIKVAALINYMSEALCVSAGKYSDLFLQNVIKVISELMY